MSKTLAMLVNTTSQRAIGRADRVEAELNEAGWATIRASRSPGQSVEQIAEKVSGSQALVVVGGDGTVRLMADVAGYLDIPIWQIGAGNENLFARSLGMKSDSASLIAALEHGNVHHVDRLDINGVPGLLMVSSGFDAQIVHEIATRRSGSVNNTNYILPTLRALAGWKPSRITIRVDGAEKIVSRRGWIVIANSPDYGGRFDPVPDALMDDSMLDVLFVPMRGRLGVIDWICRCRIGLTRRDSPLLKGRRIFSCRGEHVEVRVEPDSPWQVDGDPLDGEVLEDGWLKIRIEPGAIPVLLPATSRKPLRALNPGQADRV